MFKYVNIYSVSIFFVSCYIIWYNLPSTQRAREYAEVQQNRAYVYSTKNQLWQKCFSEKTQRDYFSGSNDFEYDQQKAYECFKSSNTQSWVSRKENKSVQSSTIRQANAEEENNSLSIIPYENQFYCENRLKTTAIELHYTAENYSGKTNLQVLQSIGSSHKARFGASGIWYHYIITKDGSIYNTRPKNCRAIADAWYEQQLFSNENTEHVHIAFVGDDKPSKVQTASMIKLTQVLLDEYWLSSSQVTSHSENAPKNYRENITYWYDSKEKFLKNFTDWITPQPVVSIDGKINDLATYAWRTYQDMDFVLTIMAESGWNPQSYGDKDNPEPGAYSYWLCQLNSKWQPQKLKEYKSAKYVVTAIDYCYSYYKTWVDDGVISRMLHGYNVRDKVRDRVIFY